MGFGAMLVGHLNPTVVAKVKESLDDIGTLFVTPSPISTEVAERFKERFGLDMLRFTNSGTESTMYAVRAARAYTGQKAIVKIEGGYHGGYDGLSVSVKPGIDEIGPADNPIPQVPFDVEPGVVHVVAYNDLGQMERVLAAHGNKVACVVMEPVIENLGIVLPDAGYLAGVRALCDAHNVLLIFDEVKTGLTAGSPAQPRAGRQARPDHVGQVHRRRPAAGRLRRTAEVMQVVVDNRMAHFGTYNGNPLCMAAALAVDEVATQQALAAAEQVNDNAMEAMDTIIREYELPAHTVGFGVKGAVTWSPTPIRNYRDYKLSTDFEVAELGWLWGINRGVLTPPGLDDQWLVSLAHTDADMGSGSTLRRTGQGVTRLTSRNGVRRRPSTGRRRRVLREVVTLRAAARPSGAPGRRTVATSGTIGCTRLPIQPREPCDPLHARRRPHGRARRRRGSRRRGRCDAPGAPRPRRSARRRRGLPP